MSYASGHGMNDGVSQFAVTGSVKQKIDFGQVIPSRGHCDYSSARSIFIEVRSGDGRALNLLEVLALDTNGNRILPSSAVMSSTHSSSYPAYKCIDQQTSNSMCHTASGDPDPWLRINYAPGALENLGRIIIYNRVDCCGWRTSEGTVTVGKSEPTSTSWARSSSNKIYTGSLSGISSVYNLAVPPPKKGYTICSAVRYRTACSCSMKRILTSSLSTSNWLFGHLEGVSGLEFFGYDTSPGPRICTTFHCYYSTSEWVKYRTNINPSQRNEHPFDWLLMCSSLDKDEEEVQEMVLDNDNGNKKYKKFSSIDVVGSGGRPYKVQINPDSYTSSWAKDQRSDFQILELLTFDKVLAKDEMETVLDSFKTLLDTTSDTYEFEMTFDEPEELFVAMNYCPSHCESLTQIHLKRDRECHACTASWRAAASSKAQFSVGYAITEAPSKAPTIAPTSSPTDAPTTSPTDAPTLSPTTASPTQTLCKNGVKDGDETDVDCGGSCGRCVARKLCNIPSDCKSARCVSCLWEGCDVEGGLVCAAPTTAPTEAPSVQPTRVPTSSPTEGPTASPSLAPTSQPTMAPTTSGPTLSPTTLAPTFAPTSSDTPAPTSVVEYDKCGVKQKCLKGTESCCDSISSNIFVTSKITERILFYDLKTSTYIKFLERNGDEVESTVISGNQEGGEEEEEEEEEAISPAEFQSDTVSMFTSESEKLSMAKQHGSSQIAFSSSGREIYFTRSASSAASRQGSLEAFHAQTGKHQNTVMSSTQFKKMSGFEYLEKPFDPMALRVFDNKNGTKAWVFSEQRLGAARSEATKRRNSVNTSATRLSRR